MYAIYEMNAATLGKSRVFPCQTFADFDQAETYLENTVGVVLFEQDPDGHDAADVFTTLGQVFSVERLK